MNFDDLLSLALAGISLDLDQLKFVCSSAKSHLETLPNCVTLSGPLTVVGDLRGQFETLLRIFEINGKPPDINYLFLGNYVGPGDASPGPPSSGSIEVVTLLFLLLVRYPARVHLLRGLHESRRNCRILSDFEHVVWDRFPETEAEDEHSVSRNVVFHAIMEVINRLPYCAVVDQQIFCVHSGISPYVDCVGHINLLDRMKETPLEGPLRDLVATRPDDGDYFVLSPAGSNFNDYGWKVLKLFLKNHTPPMCLMIRSHDVSLEGFERAFDGQVLTIFSADGHLKWDAGDANHGAICLIGDDRSLRILTYLGDEVGNVEMSIGEREGESD